MALIRRWLPHDIIAAELLNELPQDILSDFVKNGYTISAGTGLQAVVAAGVAYISDGSQRFRVEHDAQNTLSLTASSTNHVFLNQDGTFTVNTTGTPPSNSIKLGRAVTDASSVTATYDDRPLKPITQNEIRDGSIANAQVADAAAIAQSKLSLNADPGAHQTRHQPSGADALPWGSGGGLDADKLDGKHDSDLQPLAETIHLDASRSTQGWGEVATVQPT